MNPESTLRTNVPKSTPSPSPPPKSTLADIFIFLTYLSEEYKIDLLKEVEKKIADGRVLSLIERYLNQEVLGETPSYATDAAEGTPQGAVISPLLANIYLHPIDEVMAAVGYEAGSRISNTVVAVSS